MPVRGRTGRVAGRALRAPGQLSGRTLACAGGAWPHGPSRGTGAEGARAVIGPSARLRGRCVAARAKPPSCVPQGREGPVKPSARTRFHLSIRRGVQPPLQGANCPGCNPRGREASARTGASVSSPLQGAKRQRRHSAGAWPHRPSRGARAEGARAVIGPSPRLRGVRGRTGHAAFLRPAKAERSQQSHRRGRALSSRRARAKRAARGAK